MSTRELKNGDGTADVNCMVSSKTEGLVQFNKGEYLFKAGQTAGKLYVIQQGLVALSVPGSPKEIELLKAAQGQVVGEEAFHGAPTYATSALALNDTLAIEVTASQARGLLAGVVPMMKFITTGMLAKQAAILGEIAAFKTQNDVTTPCPLDKVTKMFSVVFHVATYTGKKRKDGATTVGWPAFRKYCQRVFLESPVRLEQAMWILVNTRLAEMQMVKSETDPEAPEELGFVHFTNLAEIGEFAKFFRENFEPRDPDSIKGTAAARGDVYLEVLNEIDTWNEKGLPRNMPVPPDPNAKFPPKKKAS